MKKILKQLSYANLLYIALFLFLLSSETYRMFTGVEEFNFSFMMLMLLQLFLLSFGISILMDDIYHYRNQRKTLFIKDYDAHENELTETLHQLYPYLTEDERYEVVIYLRAFFLSLAQKNIPFIQKDTHYTEVSVVLNQAWRIFSEREEYPLFSQQALSFYLKYKLIKGREDKHYHLPQDERFLKLWVEECKKENIDPFFPKILPTLFTLDQRLKILDGIRFTVNEAQLRERLNIENAPKIFELISEIRAGEDYNYLAKKLQYYLTNSSYYALFYREELHQLLIVIDAKKELAPLVYGKYTDGSIFKSSLLAKVKKRPPPFDASLACSSGASL